MKLNFFINKIISPISFIIGFIFIFLNYEKIFQNSHNSYLYLLLVFIFHSTYLFILNLRSFTILRKKVSKKVNFIDWSKVFFKSILVQDTILSQSGFLFRSIYLRSLNVQYHELSTFFYFGLLTHVIINLTWTLFEINFFIKTSKSQIFIQFFLMAIIYLLIYLIPYIFFYLKNIFLKRIQLKKLESFLKEIILNQKKYFHDFNFIITIFLITTVTHIFELLVFYCAFSYFLNDYNLINIIILFGIGTLSDRIPLISTIPFVRESIFGLVSLSFGIAFSDAFLIKLLTTVASILGSIINLLWSFLFSDGSKIKL